MKPINANRLSSIVLTLLDILADSDNWVLSLLLLRDGDGATTTTFLPLVGLVGSSDEVSAGNVGSTSLSCSLLLLLMIWLGF
jgi:hypothetical protein